MAAEYITLEMASNMSQWREMERGWRLKHTWGRQSDAATYAQRCEHLLHIPCSTIQTVDGKYTVFTVYRPDSRV